MLTFVDTTASVGTMNHQIITWAWLNATKVLKSKNDRAISQDGSVTR